MKLLILYFLLSLSIYSSICQRPSTHYDLLNVSSVASLQQIKEAYRRLVLQHHPDRSVNPNAHEIFCELREAYDTLKDADKRRAYDEKLRIRFGFDQYQKPTSWYETFKSSMYDLKNLKDDWLEKAGALFCKAIRRINRYLDWPLLEYLNPLCGIDWKDL